MSWWGIVLPVIGFLLLLAFIVYEEWNSARLNQDWF